MRQHVASRRFSRALVPVCSLLWSALPALAQDAPKPVDPLYADARIAGQEVGVPTRRKYVAPEYPGPAAEQGIRGIVILEVLIGESGSVLDARVTRSIPGLDEAAIRAVKLWEYEPTKLAGRSVKVLLSQSITFSFKLPDLQRSPGIPELRGGGNPPPPAALQGPQHAAVAVTLGAQGEVKEASLVEGPAGVGEGLLRVVKSWRFSLAEGAEPPSFTVLADWIAGPPPTVTLRAVELRQGKEATAAARAALAKGIDAPATPAPSPAAAATAAASPAATPATTTTVAPVATEVLPARQDAPALERGVSTIGDVLLGENIPDLVKGRRPTWPPLARLGAITGEVVVRFSVDVAGKVTVHSAEGPELLKASAEQAVGTWLFRRTAIDRLHLIATFKFGNDRSVARVERAPAQTN